MFGQLIKHLRTKNKTKRKTPIFKVKGAKKLKISVTRNIISFHSSPLLLKYILINKEKIATFTFVGVQLLN